MTDSKIVEPAPAAGTQTNGHLRSAVPETGTSTPPGEPPAIQQTAISASERRSLLIRAVLPVVVGIVLALLPAPAGLSSTAWRFFALFAAVIVGLVTEPLPPAAVGLVGVVIAGVLGLVSNEPPKAIAWALSGFSNTTIWLIFAAYMFADGYAKTGLGKRIALHLIRLLGRRTLGLGYAVAFADLALAPFTPSNTARSGGTIYPIIKNVPPLYGSLPGDTGRKLGAYLYYTALSITCVTSSAFLTGVAPNVLVQSLAGKIAKVSFSWTDWFIGFLPVAVVLFFGLPLLLYWIYPPEVKEAPEAPRWAARELESMGPMSGAEYRLLGVVVVILGLWVAGSGIMDATMAALLGVAALVLCRIVTWNDIIANKQAWNVLLWFATLVTLASGLVQVKFVDWLGQTLAPAFRGLPMVMAVVLIGASFFLLHYLFASLTAHTTALFPVFLAVGLTVSGFSPKAWVLLLGYALGLMGILTPYATGPSPIYFGSGYISSRDFWLYGALLGLIFLVVYLAIGIPWLLFLGM
jgi:L-tartrate/succinate antiporter